MKPLTERFLTSVFRMGRYRAWWVVLLWLLATGFAVYYSLGIPFRGSFLDLLPRNDPLIDEYRESEQYSADFVALLLELVEDVPESLEARKERLLQAAEQLAGMLSQEAEFVSVTYLPEISPEIPDQYIQLFSLTEERLLQIEQSVELAQSAIGGEAAGAFSFELPDAYREVRSLDELYGMLSEQFTDALLGGQVSLSEGTMGSGSLTEQLELVATLNRGIYGTLGGLEGLDAVTGAVLDLSEIFEADIDERARDPQPWISEDHTKLVMTIEPQYPSQRGVEYSRLVTNLVDGYIESSGLDALGVVVRTTGTYSFNTLTNDAVNADMLRTTIISSVGVFVIFVLAFGSIFYSMIAVIPLLVSVFMTTAWARFAVDGFNLVTTFLPALVLGLGIDYAIHMIARYAEERSNGRPLNRALHTAVVQKGKASLFAAITTALVFLGLLTARSRAMFEMGAITSVGVMIAFFATLFLVPALISLSHFLFRLRRKEGIASYAPKLSGMFQLITGKARAVFVIILVLTFFVMFQAARTQLVFSSTDLIPHVETQDVADEIAAEFLDSPASIGSSFTFYAATGQELRTIVSMLKDTQLQAEAFGLPDIIEMIASPLDFISVNLSEQQQILNKLDIGAYIAQLDLLQTSLEHESNVVAQTRTLLAQFSLLQYAAALNGEVEIDARVNDIMIQLRDIQVALDRMDVADRVESLQALRLALLALDESLKEVRDLPPAEELLRDVLLAQPEAIRAGFLTSDGRFVIQARVSRRIFDDDNMDRFDAFAASFSNDYFGLPLVVSKLESDMKRDFYLSTGIAALLIVVVLWASLRGWMRALLASAPLVLGYIWMLGGMRLLTIDFNFLSITISPLLIGIGVDNGIHILHRTMEEYRAGLPGAVERGVGTTAISVVVTSLTTMLVFGSLLLARTPGLRLLGISALLGIGFALLFSLLFLPAAMRLEGGKRV